MSKSGAPELTGLLQRVGPVTPLTVPPHPGQSASDAALSMPPPSPQLSPDGSTVSSSTPTLVQRLASPKQSDAGKVEAGEMAQTGRVQGVMSATTPQLSPRPPPPASTHHPTLLLPPSIQAAIAAVRKSTPSAQLSPASMGLISPSPTATMPQIQHLLTSGESRSSSTLSTSHAVLGFSRPATSAPTQLGISSSLMSQLKAAAAANKHAASSSKHSPVSFVATAASSVSKMSSLHAALTTDLPPARPPTKPTLALLARQNSAPPKGAHKQVSKPDHA